MWEKLLLDFFKVGQSAAGLSRYLYSNVFMAGCAGTHLEFGGSEKTDRRSTESSIIGKSSDLKSELLLCNENV